MFNSQKINNDPEPYIIDFGLALGTVRSSEDAGSHWDSHDTYYDPRPEYDNHPNPILLSFRADAEESVGTDAGEFIETVSTLATHWLNSDGVGDGYATPAHIDHAYKVLTSLVNIFGTEEP